MQNVESISWIYAKHNLNNHEQQTCNMILYEYSEIMFQSGGRWIGRDKHTQKNGKTPTYKIHQESKI